MYGKCIGKYAIHESYGYANPAFLAIDILKSFGFGDVRGPSDTDADTCIGYDWKTKATKG